MAIDLLTLAVEDGFQAVRISESRGGQHNGPCPFEGCGGMDRFRIQPDQGPYGWFCCSQCGRKGSTIDYLMLKRHIRKEEALAMVGWKPKHEHEDTSFVPSIRIYDPRPRWEAPSRQWQEGASQFYRACQQALWSSEGTAALDYLRGRGLTDPIIKAATLGYHPQETIGPAKDWGRPVKLPQGITIPWFFKKNIWRITVRNERVPEGAGRYTQITGGSNGLYMANLLTKLPLRPLVVMTEGELDALSIFHECRDLVGVVATGTTQGSHTPFWVSLVGHQNRVLVAFDAEEKGDAAAQWWVKNLKNAQRYKPWRKDANSMLQNGEIFDCGSQVR